VWRETPIDAAIFCEAITNNSARPVLTRILHLFRELFYRARASGLIKHNQLAFPVSPVQIGEGLGISIVTVNRTLQRLRATGAADFRDGTYPEQTSDSFHNRPNHQGALPTDLTNSTM
jgi:hypothetical protein